jgi:hypothetical protein
MRGVSHWELLRNWSRHAPSDGGEFCFVFWRFIVSVQDDRVDFDINFIFYSETFFKIYNVLLIFKRFLLIYYCFELLKVVFFQIKSYNKCNAYTRQFIYYAEPHIMHHFKIDWFLSYLAFVSKTDVSPHDHVKLRNMFNIPSLSSRRTDIDVHFLTFLLNGTFDASNLLAEIPFKVPTRRTRNLDQFYVPHHSTAYGYNNPLYRMLRVINLNVP